MVSNCPHCGVSIDETSDACIRCGGALSLRMLSSSLPAPPGLLGSERREATVLFCDLGGYTRWNESEDPEEIASVMETIRREALRIFGSYGGIVNQFVGDEVMGLFGVVSAHDDDPCRALAAALALHAYLRSDSAPRTRHGPALRFHSGAETGLVYARVNDLRSGLFEVTGEVVNTAARLRSLAGADEILCGPAARRRVAPYFLLEELDAVQLHGTAQAMVPQRVLGPSAAVSRFDTATVRGLTKYVNRERELHALSERWAEASRGHGQVVTVSGPAGVGKSRLLHEFRLRVEPHALVMYGRCSAYRNVAPYQPFTDALCGLADDAADAATQVRSLADRYRLSAAGLTALEYLLKPSGAEPVLARIRGGELRGAIVDALDELIRHAATDRPVLALFEDWHWADEASRTALREIGERIAGRRVLIVVNFRSTELAEQAQPRSSHRLQLEPLSPPSTEAMASKVLGGEMPAGLSEFVHGRTLGNPFFVEEICRELMERGTCKTESDSVVLLKPLFEFRAPSTVQATVRARVDRLPEAQRDLLRWAAVIGQHFDLASLEALAVESDAPEAAEGSDVPRRVRLLELLSALEVQGLIDRDSTLPPAYHFRHAITQEVVYESLPVQLRRSYHVRVAHEIEARTPVEQLEGKSEALAHHYRFGGERERAIGYAVMAGDKAWRSFSLEQAGLQYRHALEQLDSLLEERLDYRERYIEVSLSLARVGIYNPDADQVQALQQALEFAEELQDARRVCLCLNWLSWIEYGCGNPIPAQRYAEEFLEEARALGDTVFIAQALINVGRCQGVATDYDRAIETIQNGLELRARERGAAHGFALGNLTTIYGDQGHFERAFDLLDRAFARTRPAQLSLIGPLLIHRGMLQCWKGDWQACIETSEEAQHVAERIEGKYILGMSLSLSGFARFMAGGLSQADANAALASLRQGVNLIERHGSRLHVSYLWGMLASALAVAGDYTDAEEAAERTLQRAAEQDRLGEVDGQRVLAIVAGLRDAELPRSEELFERAMQTARAKHSERELSLCEWSLASVLRARGHLRRAEKALESARARAQALGLRLPPEARQHRGLIEGQP